MKGSDENKHCNGALIKDRTVAFHFHCPRTYSSASWYMTGLHTVLSNNSWDFSILSSYTGQTEQLEQFEGAKARHFI